MLKCFHVIKKMPYYDNVEKRNWVNARGSVQNDTFVRDLIMMANDIMKFSGPSRKDKAKEEEKRVELHLIRQ